MLKRTLSTQVNEPLSARDPGRLRRSVERGRPIGDGRRLHNSNCVAVSVPLAIMALTPAHFRAWDSQQEAELQGGRPSRFRGHPGATGTGRSRSIPSVPMPTA